MSIIIIIIIIIICISVCMYVWVCLCGIYVSVCVYVCMCACGLCVSVCVCLCKWYLCVSVFVCIGEEEELAKLVQHLDKTSRAYGMEINAEKTKLMTNNTSGIYKVIEVNRQKLDKITSFKYRGSIITDEGSKT